jgi:hypothetical protein
MHGGTLPVIGSTTLEINFGGKIIKQLFTVVTKMNSKPLLGNVFRIQHKVNILHDNYITIDGHEVPYLENEIDHKNNSDEKLKLNEIIKEKENVKTKEEILLENTKNIKVKIISNNKVKGMSKSLISCSMINADTNEPIDPKLLNNKLLLIDRNINEKEQYMIPYGVVDFKYDGLFPMEIITVGNSIKNLDGIILTTAKIYDKEDLQLGVESNRNIPITKKCEYIHEYNNKFNYNQ